MSFQGDVELEELFWEVVESLRAKQYFHLDRPISHETFDRLGERLGNIVRCEEVRLGLSARLVHSNKYLPYHTDQPYVDILAWQCIRPDPEVPTMLLDMARIIQEVDPAILDLLKKVTVFYPNPDNMPSPNNPKKLETAPLINIKQGYLDLFYISFRGSSEMEPEVRDAWNWFNEFVEKEAKTKAFGIILKQNECLFIHNKSLFHGRNAYSPASPRFLKRLWIQSDLVKGVKATEALS